MDKSPAAARLLGVAAAGDLPTASKNTRLTLGWPPGMQIPEEPEKGHIDEVLPGVGYGGQLGS
jgi:hypothetical protein